MRTDELDHILEESLRSKPGFQLSDDFARKVTAEVTRKVQLKIDLLEYLYLVGIIISLLAVTTGLFYFVDKDMVIRFLSFVSGNAIQVLLAVLLLNFILFADKVLLGLLFRQQKT